MIVAAASGEAIGVGLFVLFLIVVVVGGVLSLNDGTK